METTRIGDEIWAVGGSEDLVRDVLTARSRDAIRALDDSQTFFVGNARGSITEALMEASDSRLLNFFADRAMDESAGRASTVSSETETSGVLLNADELERRLEAVAALADAFEDATGDASQ